jgi:hypothetical protein
MPGHQERSQAQNRRMAERGVARGSDVAMGKLVCCMNAGTSIDLAPTCLHKFIAQRSLL